MSICRAGRGEYFRCTSRKVWKYPRQTNDSLDDARSTSERTSIQQRPWADHNRKLSWQNPSSIWYHDVQSTNTSEHRHSCLTVTMSLTPAMGLSWAIYVVSYPAQTQMMRYVGLLQLLCNRPSILCQRSPLCILRSSSCSPFLSPLLSNHCRK